MLNLDLADIRDRLLPLIAAKAGADRAEDLFHSAVVKLAEKPMRDDSLPAVEAWLITTALNKAVDLARRRKREAARRKAMAWAGLVGDVFDPEAEEAWAECLESVREALTCLRDDRRAVIVACYFEGLSAEEIAQRYGRSSRTIFRRIGEAMKELKALIAAD